MAIRVRAMLRKWFGRGMYPTAEQFSDLFDSFWHKTEDEISMDKVGGLTDQLNGKYPAAANSLRMAASSSRSWSMASSVCSM